MIFHLGGSRQRRARTFQHDEGWLRAAYVAQVLSLVAVVVFLVCVVTGQANNWSATTAFSTMGAILGLGILGLVAATRRTEFPGLIYRALAILTVVILVTGVLAAA